MAHSRGTYLSIQYLRAIAALMVVVHHARNPSEEGFSPLADYNGFAHGVVIFFVISGFIMGVVGSTSEPRDFIVKRLVRIVPLYWIATGTLVLITLVVAAEAPDLGYLLKSLAFIPEYRPDGSGIYPYLFPGWTLNFEMFFYLLFFVGLLVRRPLAVDCTVIPALVILGAVLEPTNPIAATFTDPLLLAFLAGHLLAALHLAGRLPTSPWLGLALPVGFVALMAPGITDLVWVQISASIAIVFGALAVDDRVPYARVPKLLGDASYSIYLGHVILLLLLTRLVAVLPAGPTQFWALIVSGLVLSAVVGVAAHLIVEKPLLEFLRARLIDRKSATPQEFASPPVK